jgi:hypothetical protein
MFYLIARNGVTGKQIVEAYASPGFLTVIAIELIDKKWDKRSFWQKLAKKDDYRFVIMIVGIIVLYIAIVSLITGTLTIDVSKAPISAHIVALTFMFYLLSPETGSSEWLLFGYIAATLATGFTKFSLVPGLSVSFIQAHIPAIGQVWALLVG